MTNALRPVVGLVTIGQSPRPDIVPDMAAIIGPGVDIREAGALDGLTPRGRRRAEADRRRRDPRHPPARRHRRLRRQAEDRPAWSKSASPRLEREGAQLTALLCTGAFPPLRATRSLIQPQPVLFGTLRGMSWPGRLGVVTPSVPHVPQTEARWRGDGFDPVVVPLSPYEEEDPAALRRAGGALRSAGVGLVVMDCMGFRRKTRDEMRDLTGAPVLLANFLVARVIAELCGA